MKKERYTFAERAMLQHAYLPKLALDCFGMIGSGALLWQGHMLFGLAVLIGFSLLGTAVACRQDISKLAETRLGNWMLYQAKPINIVVRTLGAAILVSGLWLHSVQVIIGGIATIFLGRYLSKR